MPLDPNLNVSYGGQDAAIDTALTTALNTLATVIGNPLNLSDKERQTTPSVDEQRETYVADAVTALGSQYPNLLGPEVTLVRAQTLWAFRNESRPLLAKAQAIVDMLGDVSINAENITLKFTEDLRDNAQRNKDRNVPGADVVWDHLQGLHTQEPQDEQP